MANGYTVESHVGAKRTYTRLETAGKMPIYGRPVRAYYFLHLLEFAVLPPECTDCDCEETCASIYYRILSFKYVASAADAIYFSDSTLFEFLSLRYSALK
jgi:hypothetical protein